MAAKLNIFESKWVNMVFEGRNQEYGAFVLRKKSSEYTIKGIILAIVFFTLSIAAPVIVNIIKANLPKEKVVVADDITKLEEPPPIDKNEPPPPPTEPPPPLKSTVKFTPPEIKPDEEVPDEPPPTQEDLKVVDAGTKTEEGDPNGVDPSLSEDAGTGEAVPEILTFAEQMPEYPGGDEARIEFLSKNINYPPLARESGIEGRVILQFVVGRDGKITDVEQVGKKLGWGCDEEAIRVVKLMPDWKPGKQNGKEVTVRYTLQIAFKLN